MSGHRTLALAVALMVAASPLAAQSFTPAPSTRPLSALSAPAATVLSSHAVSASMAGASPVRVQGVASAPSATALVQPAYNRTRNNTALMIVGGAALLAGAVIGGDSGTIIMIGGATVGLVGMYRYLR